MGCREGARLEDISHAFKDMSGRKELGKGLEPGGQGGDRIEDRGKWLDHEGDSPGQGLSPVAEAQDKADRDQSQGPAEEKEVEVEGNESDLKIEEIELVGRDGNDRENETGENDPAEPYQEHGPDVFCGSHWRGEDIQEIACPDIFQKRDGYSLLGAEEGIPQNDGPDQVCDCLREVPRRLGLEIFGQESPDEQLHERPENELDDSYWVTGVEPEISQGDRAEDTEVHAGGGTALLGA